MRIFLLLFALLCLFTSFAGPGLNDWTYVLPNGYEMWHINSRQIKIGLAENQGLALTDNEANSIGIPAHIVAFWHDDRFVCAQTILPDDVDAYGDGRTVETSYYLLDTLEQYVYGPINEATEFDAIVEQVIGDAEVPYVQTWPKPEGARYLGE